MNKGRGIFEMLLQDAEVRDFCAAKDAYITIKNEADVFEERLRNKLLQSAIYEEAREEENLTRYFEQTDDYKNVLLYLDELYPNEFEKTFWQKKFRTKNKNAKNKNAKKVFLKKWKALLERKVKIKSDEFIETEIKNFITEVKARIKNLKFAAKTFRVKKEELGTMWNKMRGVWSRASYDVLSEYSDYFLRDAYLQDLCRKLGRGRKIKPRSQEEEKQEQKIISLTNEKGETTGITCGGDLSSVLPQELVMLLDSGAEALFYKKRREEKLLCYEYAAYSYAKKNLKAGAKNRRQEEGPFIICIDSSGSMRGEKEKIAKSLVFAVLKTALRQERNCYLISFSTGIETMELDGIMEDEKTMAELIDFLSMSFNGGSDALEAFNKVLQMLNTNSYKDADVLFVSDFILPPVAEEALSGMSEAKKNGTLFHAVLTGSLIDEALNKEMLALFDSNTPIMALPSAAYLPDV